MVIIETLDLPDNCYDCKLRIFDQCLALKSTFYLDNIANNRNPKCPMHMISMKSMDLLSNIKKEIEELLTECIEEYDADEIMAYNKVLKIINKYNIKGINK